MLGIGVERRGAAKWPELVVLLLWDYALFFLRALEQKYSQEISKEFMGSSFIQNHERLKLVSGGLTETSIQILSRHMNQFIDKFEELSELDSTVDRKKSKPISSVIAYRTWTFSVVSRYEKQHPFFSAC